MAGGEVIKQCGRKFLFGCTKSILPFLLLLCISNEHFSQERHGMFWNYTVEDGLPSNEVYHIHEDSKGYIWFATSNGISRFDGYEFQNYSVEEGIEDSDIFQIEEGQGGILYLYSISGRLYQGNDEGFEFYKYQEVIDSVIRVNKEFGTLSQGYIEIDTNNNLHYIWPGLHIILNKEGLLNCSYETNHAHKLLDTGGMFLLIPPSNRLTAKARHIRDSLEYNELISGLEIQTDKKAKLSLPLHQHINFKPGFSGSKKWCYVKIPDDKYLIMYNSTLYIVDEGELLWRSQPVQEIEVLRVLSNGAVLVGLIKNNGLRYYENLDALKSDDYKTILAGSSVSFVFLDQHDIAWISTTNGGVYRTTLSNLLTTYDGTEIIKDDYTQLASDNIDELYTVNSRNEIAKIDLISKNRIPIEFKPYQRIKDIVYDGSGDNIWVTSGTLFHIGERARPIYLPGEFRNRFTLSYWNTVEQLSCGNNSIHLDGDRIWTTSSDGFMCLDKYSFDPINIEFPYYMNSAIRVHDVFPKKSDLVWVGTQHGVFTYDFDTVQLSSNEVLNQNIPVYHIENSPIGIFFGTKGRGIYHYTNDQTSVIGEAEGLTSNFVEALLPLDSNEVWVGTPEGLDRIIFDRSGGYEFKYYSVATGLPSNSINDLEYCGGKIYVATPEGLGIIDPEEDIETSPIRPVMREVLVNNEDYDERQLIDLAYTDNNLILRYDCLDYKQMGNTLYRYRLSDRQQWNETKERTVNLLRLPPGAYRFEVQARGADRSWSGSKVLAFSIAAPFWQTLWFWLITGLAGIGAVAGYTHYRFRAVQRQARLQQKIAQLERQALRAQMNPHFIFNVLHSIQGYISEGDTQNATRYVSKFARLIRATLNHTRMTRIPLDEEIRNLREYLDLENMRMDGRLSFDFHLDNEVDEYGIDVPPMLLQPFLENAIKHGIAPKGDPGHIDLYFRRINHHLEVEIVDDGIGIRESMRRKNELEQGEESLGMRIAQERLAVLEGASLDEHIQVEQMEDEEGNAIGTRVVLRIKIEEGSA